MRVARDTGMDMKILIPFVAVLSIACSEPPKPTPPPPPVAKAPPKAAASVKIEVPNIFTNRSDDYFYNPVGKRDPFKQFEEELIQEVVQSRSPLERYDLDDLMLTAIVWGISDPRALLRAPDGYSYIIKANSRVGRNRGRVARITRRQVFIEEEYRDPTGKLVVKESTFGFQVKMDKEKQALQLKMSDE